MGELVQRLKLREYQQRAVREVADAYRSGSRAILLVMPTGAGKTVTGLRFAIGAVEKGKRVVWLAHRRELIHQTADKLRRFEVPHGIIMAGTPMALQQPVQVHRAGARSRRRRD